MSTFCFSQGLGCYLLFEPFKTRPVSEILLVSFFFSLFGVFADAVFLFFLLSLSQALGKPKPLLGVWGSPCVFLVPAALMHLDPFTTLDIYTKVTAPALFFFFFRSSFALGCGRFVSWRLVLGRQSCCHICLFPPLRKGEMLSVFVIFAFCAWFGVVFVFFFAVFLF